MNIYELEQKATPGPWEVAHDSTGYHAEHDGYPVLDGSEPKDEINAMLSSHCRNNFMRALEALKNEHEKYQDFLGEHGSSCGGLWMCKTCKLIAELEEVK